MRTPAFLLLVCVCVASLVSAAPTAPLCPSLPVQLELRPQGVSRQQQMPVYSLTFAAIDPKANMQQPDFVDIHYRVNNEDSTNLRVLTQAGITADTNQRAKQAQVDNIVLAPGDVIRAYATYSAKGYACDTPIHTFNAPDMMEFANLNNNNIRQQQMNPNNQQQWGARNINNQMLNRGSWMGMDEEQFDNQFMNQMPNNNFNNINNIRAQRTLINPTNTVLPRRDTLPTRRTSHPLDNFHPASQDFQISAAIEQATLQEPTTQAVCPSIPLQEEVLKVAGLDNTYALSFENMNPNKQLHYVDLHLTTDTNGDAWDNLRLASDMQLNSAHKVIQPGVVVHPNDNLHWYWSYRTATHDGAIIDCTTEVQSISPKEITHEVSLAALRAAGNQ